MNTDKTPNFAFPVNFVALNFFIVIKRKEKVFTYQSNKLCGFRFLQNYSIYFVSHVILLDANNKKPTISGVLAIADICIASLKVMT